MSDSPMDLETAIEQCINLGLKEPRAIVKRLHADHGDEWMREQGAFYADDLAADMARRMIGSQRRGFEMALPSR